jgi:cytochrome o ubiquinol oxidase subunit IV
MSAHGEHHDTAPSHSTMRGYMTGFGLSVVLTAIPFWLVMSRALDSTLATALIIMAFAIVQIFVHMVYFLHMDAKAEGGWTVMALIFTLVLVIIALTGSLWIMYHLDTNMMPGMMEGDMQEMEGGGTEGMPGFGMEGMSEDMTDEGAADQGPSDEGTSGAGTSDENTAEEGTVGQGMPEDHGH